ncbi:DUF2293 domain-containing protein [bacterium]|nr:MAG: DUF2293 domain-containing protein [bacterium]
MKATRQWNKEGEILVVSVLNSTKCAECGAEMETGDFLRMQDAGTICLECADLDHLTFLPSGNVALTRRSKKLSGLWAVVVRFNKRRNRYERQGMLVEEAALVAAEEACADDADVRAVARERAGVRRERQDVEYIASFTQEVQSRYPGCPAEEARTIAEHACEKYSGRVGRSARAKEFDQKAVDLAVRAHIRHVHTDYDALLLGGVTRDEARAKILGRVDGVAAAWRKGE